MSEPNLTASDLSQRMQRIRLPQMMLAQLSGVGHDTINRFLGRRDVRPITKRALEAALIGEEIALRNYLLALHPLRAEPANVEAPQYRGGLRAVS